MALSSRLSLRRKITFAGLASLLVLGGGWGLAEVVLRIAGVGHPVGFFREETDPSGKVWVRENRWAMAPYFPEAVLRRPLPLRFARDKDASTYRLFVLGSSAAMGDPEPSFGIARTTERLLQAAYPEIRFEVVNASVTAINSHVVRAIARDCAEYQPDGFFVYEGNNEVIGPYGPGTVWRPWLSNPAWVRLGSTLQSSRVVQVLLRGFSSSSTTTPSSWGGLQSFLEHSIERDDPRLAMVEQRFAENLAAIAAEGKQAGASVWLSTVLVNQRHFAPFRSAPPADLSPSDLARWSAQLEAGRAALTQRDWPEAESALLSAWALHDGHAETAFLLGEVHRETNRIQESDTWFSRAVELDTLRFRADRRLNEAVRRAAGFSGAGLLDGEALARARPEGLGDGLLYEHVHLNMAGTYLVARTLAEAVAQDLLRKGRAAKAPGPEDWLPLAEIRRRLAFSPYEQVLILQELIDRFGRPPFLGRWGNEAQLAGLKEREAKIRSLALAPETRAPLLELYTQALNRAPEDPVLWRNYGTVATALGETKIGLEALQRALFFTPEDTDALAAALAAAHRQGDARLEGTLRARLEALEPRHPGLRVSEK